jgi:hypothetical protein
VGDSAGVDRRCAPLLLSPLHCVALAASLSTNANAPQNASAAVRTSSTSRTATDNAVLCCRHLLARKCDRVIAVVCV